MLPTLPDTITTNNGSIAANLAIRKGNRTGIVYVIGTVDPIDPRENLSVEDGLVVMWDLSGKVIYPSHRGYNWGIKLPFQDITKVDRTEFGYSIKNLHWDIEAGSLVLVGTEYGGIRSRTHIWTPEGSLIPGEFGREEELKLYFPKEDT